MSRSAPAAALGAVAVAALALTGCGTVVAAEPTGSSAAAQITVTDDQGREVVIDGPVERAVVLNSYANEFVRAIGAGDTVVGVDRSSLNRLPYLEITDDEVIAEGLDQINYEAVAALEPDVVVLPRNAVWQEAAEQLEGFGIPVVVATAWDYAVFDDTVDLLGEVFGAEQEADGFQAFADEIQEVVAERVEGLDTVPVYWETAEPYLTVLPGSGFHAIIEAAGGENVFAEAGGGDVQQEITVDPAEVVTRDPAVIVHEYEPAATPTEASAFEATRDELTSRPGWSAIQAVEDDQVYVANGWATSAIAKSIGALYLATWLHPEAFEDVDPDAYLERWVTEFQGTDFAGVDGYISAPGDQG
ncbi:ABC transporter substrate-binding protein [Agrococcus terreus]|uniref:Iron(III) ABC transporter substrate-binding protein n=1 Tax=Agrococcus terreus TaxID=574649 RepID=A0ABQ2KCC2_9MICO|nr:ABC transporter substrate-binding protein [Agrococcus terreus]GGN79218.1 iron(III) ABC transporter substrate-binding protein [Agrococcus terreus]